MFHDARPCSMLIEAGHSLWGVFTDQDVRIFTFPIEKKVMMNDIPSCSMMPVPVGCRSRPVKACAGYSITRMSVFLLSTLRKRLWRMTPHHVPWWPSLHDANWGWLSLCGVFNDQDVPTFTFPIEKKVMMNDILSCSTMLVPVWCCLRPADLSSWQVKSSCQPCWVSIDWSVAAPRPKVKFSVGAKPFCSKWPNLVLATKNLASHIPAYVHLLELFAPTASDFWNSRRQKMP